jgi:hypothetical protein
VSTPTVIPPPPRPLRPVPSRPDADLHPTDGPTLHVVQWIDPVADSHGMHPCSRYVELYWLGIIGPSTCDFSLAGAVNFSRAMSAGCQP